MSVTPQSDRKKAATRPSFELLFAHPLCGEDDENVDYGDGGPNGPFYPGWQADHLGRPRFYLKGSKQARILVQTQDAKRFYAAADRALRLVKAETDWASYGGDWSSPAYNQFTRAFKPRPITLERAATIIASMEAVYDEELKNGKLNGNPLELYDCLSILPACYNIDDFNTEKLEQVRKENGIGTLLSACSHRDSKLLDELAGGHTVTRITAYRIRKALLEHFPHIEVGPIRPYPGSGGLGTKAAAPSEIVRPD